MTKYLVTCSTTRVIFRKIKTTGNPLAILYGSLYRIDDKLFSSNNESSDSFVMYDIGEQQPYGRGEYLDPEFTKVLIDSMKLAKGKATKMFDFNSEAVIMIIVVGIVGFSLLTQFLG